MEIQFKGEGTILVIKGKVEPRRVDNAIHEADLFPAKMIGEGENLAIFCYPGSEERLKKVAALLGGEQGCIN